MSESTYDLVGIGFGPANLSVAIAAEEAGQPVRAVFFDRKPEFSWHEGLMFAGAEMQVSFLKDLITMRNPRSDYSFLSYLADRERLAKFVNLRTFYPTRTEFNDYYRWVAARFADRVHWGTEVVAVHPVAGAGDDVDLLDVVVRDLADGAERTVRTRNLIIAPGGQPHLPAGVQAGPRVFHASETAHRLAGSYADAAAPYRFAIVGAGQTAADVFLHLRRTYPNARIDQVIRGFALRPEDDTHFINEFFDPAMPDWFYGQPEAFRGEVLDTYGLAAHTGVSYDLIPTIYREHYEDLVTGSQAVTLHRWSEVVGAESGPDRATARLRRRDTGDTTTLEADAVILATGYRYPMPVPLLRDVQRHLTMARPDRYALRRTYDIETTSRFRPKIFLQGYAEATHGFSEVLLSLMPFRAAEIVDAAMTGAPIPAEV
ncbi:lysine N(6)-hydroxylase/L-ornithine N(5)-oxygenase family protein [Actinoplanes flavus]|uniref:L-lysine N6-monooxygenase MbtG n=1 Tax=Actinoplanes flavus TaxID=2820290 RepID=A0ABS3URD6_9ACTN|nr:SidA/IucD/PvdA family monooxygenase [Actinoplanes flavus]MBO3740237.1 lysine N(6)-hydroxylase/L-ornithine N(5)-oxygenase family protein [Actinoplanes flavus]